MRLIWSPKAHADVRGIAEYIAADNLTAALGMVDRIYGLADRLIDHPRLGRPGRLPRTRELVVARTPYLVIYRVTDVMVEVLGVIHGAQAWPPE